MIKYLRCRARLTLIFMSLVTNWIWLKKTPFVCLIRKSNAWKRIVWLTLIRKVKNDLGRNKNCMRNRNHVCRIGRIQSTRLERKKMKLALKDLKKTRKKGEESMKKKRFIKLVWSEKSSIRQISRFMKVQTESKHFNLSYFLSMHS